MDIQGNSLFIFGGDTMKIQLDRKKRFFFIALDLEVACIILSNKIEKISFGMFLYAKKDRKTRDI